MTKTKKVIAAILSAIILLTALPMGAYAATAINSVEVELNIAPGVDSENWDSFINVKTDGLVLDDLYIYDYYGNYVSEEFEIGMEYEFYIYLRLEDGFELPDSVYEFEEATVNGEEVVFNLFAMGEDENDDEYNYIEICYVTTLGGEITEVALSLDIYGEFSANNYYRYVSFETQGLEFMYSANSAVLVYDADGNPVDVDGKFEAGKEYKFEIFLCPKYSCSFFKNDDNEFELDSVTVNGEDAEYTVSSYETNGYYEYILIEATIQAKHINIIRDIDIDINTDLANVYAEDWENYVSINTDGLEFDDDNGDPAVFAYDSYGDWVEQYLPGETYYIYVYFTPEEGYSFTDDFTFDSVTVNGEEYYDYDCGSYTGLNGEEIYYIGVDIVVDIPYDNFFARIAAFFQNIINVLIALFSFTDWI